MKFAYVEGSSTGVVHGVTIVDADIEEIAAWETSKMSRENIKIRHENCLESGLKKVSVLMEWDAVVGRAKEVRRRAWLSGRR